MSAGAASSSFPVHLKPVSVSGTGVPVARASGLRFWPIPAHRWPIPVAWARAPTAVPVAWACRHGKCPGYGRVDMLTRLLILEDVSLNFRNK